MKKAAAQKERATRRARAGVQSRTPAELDAYRRSIGYAAIQTIHVRPIAAVKKTDNKNTNDKDLRPWAHSTKT